MGFELKSNGALASKLQSMRSKFQGTKIAGKLTVPDELRWWYYHEFGTATAYPIDVVFAKDLRLPETAQFPEATYVPRVGPPYTEMHPPIAARHMVGKVVDDILKYAAQTIGIALQGNLDPEAAHEALMSNVLPYAVDRITTSFAEQLPGTSVEGRLQGESAAEAFAANVRIEEL
jgi:hypothetical protein